MPTLGTEYTQTVKAQTCPTVKDIYWAAGFYDGEGCASWAEKRRACIRVTQKDTWPLERLLSLFGGRITQNKQGYFVWSLYGARARGFAMTIYTLLSPRRQEQVRKLFGPNA